MVKFFGEQKKSSALKFEIVWKFITLSLRTKGDLCLLKGTRPSHHYRQTSAVALLFLESFLIVLIIL